MMTMIEIRRAHRHEADALTRLSLKSKRSNGYDDAFMAACRDELTVTPSRLETGEYWIADADGIRGCVCLSDAPEGGVGEVHAFFVDPEWQRRGIGRRLWDKVVERGRFRGLVRLRLDADPFAVAFYESMGFSIVGKTPSGSIEGRMLPHMAIDLAEPLSGGGAAPRMVQAERNTL